MTAPILYGVWIPGEGWLSGRKPGGDRVALSFESRDVAKETALRIGRNATVYFIDDSLSAIEETLLQTEREQIAASQKDGKQWPGWMKRLRKA